MAPASTPIFLAFRGRDSSKQPKAILLDLSPIPSDHSVKVVARQRWFGALFSDRPDDAKNFYRSQNHTEKRDGRESIHDAVAGDHSGVSPVLRGSGRLTKFIR